MSAQVDDDDRDFRRSRRGALDSSHIGPVAGGNQSLSNSAGNFKRERVNIEPPRRSNMIRTTKREDDKRFECVMISLGD